MGPDGSLYFGGNPSSTNLPTSTNAFQKVNKGNRTGYVAKFSSDGTTLQYATYVGGSVYDTVSAIGVDADGCAYITGTTLSPDFPTTNGTIRTTHDGSTEAYVAKLSPDGSKLVYSTFLGGDENEGGEDLIVDRETGECLVVGYTQSRNFPTTEGAYDREPTSWDAFICGINHNGTAFRFSSFLGGEDQDRAEEVAMDGSGNIVVCGYTNSNQFPVSGTAFQRTRTGKADGFITVMDDHASRVIRSTYLGGSADDRCQGVVVSEDGDIAVGGRTWGHNLPVSSDATCSTFGGGRHDLFFSILNSDLDELEYSTYLGGPYTEYFGSLAMDAMGNIYLFGSSGSSEFPVTPNAMIGSINPGSETLVLFVMDKRGPTVLLSSFIWGDRGYGITFDGNGSMILTGTEASRDFPVTEDAYQKKKYNSYHDDAVIIIIPDFLPPRAEAGPDIAIDQHRTVSFNGTASVDNATSLNWTSTFTDEHLSNVTMYGPSPSLFFDEARRYEVVLNVTDAEGNWALDTVNVMVRDTTPPVAVLPEGVEAGQNEVMVLNGSMSTDNVGIVSWRWTVEDTGGPLDLAGEVVEHIYLEVGVFNITLKVTDAAGNWAEATMRVTVMDTTPPVADAGTDIEIDQGDTVTFDGMASTDNVGIVNWSWNLPSGTGTVHRFQPVFEYTFEDAGEFQVNLIVADAAGNSGGDSLMVHVRDTTDPVADAGEDMYAEQGLEVKLNGSSSTDNVGVVEWLWSFEDDGITRTLLGAEPTHVFEEAGEYVVELTVTDAAGNSATDTVTVTVRDTTPPTADAGEDLTVDQHEEVSFDGTSSTDSVAVVNWTWNLTYDGRERVLHGSEVSFIFEDAGTYQVTMEVSDGAGNVAVDVVSILVNDVTPPLASAGANVTVKKGETVSLDGTGSTDNVGVVNWTWTFVSKGEDVEIYGDRTEFVFERAGGYPVTITVRDAAGNEASDTFLVTVRKVESGKDTPWFLIAAVVIVGVLLIAVVWVIRGWKGPT